MSPGIDAAQLKNLRNAVAAARHQEALGRDGDVRIHWKGVETILSALDSATPEPSGEEVERVAAAMWDTERLRFPGILAWAQLPDDILERWRTRARAAIAAMRPTGEALGLARELANDINRIITPEDISRIGGVVEKARALVALLERREA